MNKTINFFIFIILLTTIGCNSDTEDTASNVSEQSNQLGNTGFQLDSLSADLANLPIETLSENESSAIIFMREEEKLARDAYDLFFQLWNQKIFDNISSAEQTHMDALLLLIDRYQLVDPIANDVAGIFENIELQSLYDSLIAIGQNSMVDALMAGAEIEEVDLIDLQVRLVESDNQDIALIFDNLMKGSRNHLRSFVSNIEKQGITYIPLHLTQEEFDDIINSPMETGSGG